MSGEKQHSDGRPAGQLFGQSTTDPIGFYGLATPIAQPSMTLSSTTALTSTAVLSVVDTGKWAWSSSTVGKAYVKRVRQMQADLKTLTQKIEALNLVAVTGN
jgi:magnesium-transporting ATPase (P-type)